MTHAGCGGAADSIILRSGDDIVSGIKINGL